MRIYLDNSATTPLDPEVLEAMLPYLREEFGNASSIHHFGQQARTAVEEAREKVAQLIGAAPREVIFTGGGTESDNLALRGVAETQKSWGRGHIVTSGIEHPAVLSTCKALENQGVRVTYLPVDKEARLRLDLLAEATSEEPFLVTVMHSNNETGTLQDMARIVEWARARSIPVHTDAVQSVGKLPINVRRLGVDLLSLSAHKFHGPKGVGALFVRQGMELAPLLFGGHQERGRRPGTENVAAIVGMGCAAELACRRLDAMQTTVRPLRDQLEESILLRIDGVRVNGSQEYRLPHISNLSFDRVEGEALTIALDLEGIAVSTGSACSSGSLEPSHVLAAMGHRREEVQGSIRFSLSHLTAEAEIDRTLEVLPRVVDRLRSFFENQPQRKDGEKLSQR